MNIGSIRQQAKPFQIGLMAQVGRSGFGEWMRKITHPAEASSPASTSAVPSPT
jgi:hypothetical protein